MNKKIGLLLMALAVVVIALFLYTSWRLKEDSGTTSDTGSEMKNVYVESGEPESFSSLGGVVEYHLHDEIADRLSPVTFDQAFTSYLKEGGIIPEAGDDSFGIIEVSDDGTVTYNIPEGTWSFVLVPNIRDAFSIYCTVEADGSYSFDSILGEQSLL